ncbi:hypothetical protein AMAG_15810 [Allomyces macrogynus ATCC 38327]|uniref:Uncharacterized protein n=1 Tax=Allomyces macrogynus (strain ATCC 38327) TaxID=578462 RepID=A0A0L0T9C4_ALLM3|nr:hypothetical protein AMAG_15810 [Allomyces macrogynus ATCC 38327]|eukprot:KNE71144.1 hypothetical protein AMAG_15810 [Allomyces macrogynus ATCC 38327]
MSSSIDAEIRKMTPAHQREFYEVKAACYACPFLYMRKDSLAVFLKRTIRPNFQLTIGTNRAFELLGRTETYTHRTTAFVYFTWKRRHLKQHPPADVRTRLKYLVMPAKIAPNMLLELYEHTYGTDNETEVLRVATSLFGEPQAGKYAIPATIYNNRMNWPQYCPPPPGSPPPFPPDAPNGELQVPPGMHSRTSSGTSDTRKRRSTNDGYIAFDDDESSDEGDASDSSDRDDAGARCVTQAMADLALDTAGEPAERAEAVERVDVVGRVEAVERVEPATVDQPSSSIPDRDQPVHPPRPQYRAARDLAQPARRVGPPASPTSSSAGSTRAPLAKSRLSVTAGMSHVPAKQRVDLQPVGPWIPPHRRPPSSSLTWTPPPGRVAPRDDRSPRWNARVLPPDEQLPTTASMSIRGLFTLLRDRARAKAGAPSRARTAAKDLTRDPATMPQGRQLTASDFFASFDDDDEDMD